MPDLKINVDFDAQYVPTGFSVIGVIHGYNGCCEDRPYIVTANKCDGWPGGINYACQCSCGLWCTSGHGTIGEAVSEYEEMTERVGREEQSRLKNKSRSRSSCEW